MLSEASCMPNSQTHFMVPISNGDQAHIPFVQHNNNMFYTEQMCGIFPQSSYHPQQPAPFVQTSVQSVVTPTSQFYTYQNTSCPISIDSRYTASNPLTNGTSSLDSCQQISHVLQCYQQGGEPVDFVRKAIESLVRKLKDKRVELDALITAITSSGKQPSGCVTIHKSLDGRLQVAGRKGVPHVVYARIWRWPNVSKSELMKLSICCIPSDHQDFICINPYHYERVVSNSMPPLDMKTLRVDPPLPQPQLKVPSKPDFSGLDYGAVRGDMRASSDVLAVQGYPSCHWMPSCTNNVQPQLMQQGVPFPPQITGDNTVYDLSQVQVPLNAALPDHWCSITYYELDSQVGETFKVRRDMKNVVVDGGMDPHAERNGRFCVGALSNVHRGDASERVRIHIGQGVQLRSLDDGSVVVEIRSRKQVFIRSGYLDYCCGVPYESKSHRYTAEQGPITVFDVRWAYKEMISRTNSATQAVQAQAAAVAGIATGPQMSNLCDVMADSGVDGMRSAFCTIAISFVKGWGDGYPRSTVKETPCWIEIQLHRPLQLLDHILKSTGPL